MLTLVIMWIAWVPVVKTDNSSKSRYFDESSVTENIEGLTLGR
jgi:uncharacterized sodium:solute symporter family permease YidK